MVLIAVILASMVMLVGCANNDTFTEKNYTSEEAVTSIEVEVRDREIEVVSSNDDKVYIDYFESEKEFYNISVADGKLVIKAEVSKEWTDFVGTKPSKDYRKIIIKVPSQVLDSLSIITTNENISVTDLNVKDVTLNSNGGNIVLDKLGANAFDLNVKNGNLTGSIVGSLDEFKISIEHKKGDSNLSEKADGSKTLNVVVNNGDIDLKFV